MGEGVKAAAILEVGLSIANELGMIPLMDEAAALQMELGSQPAKFSAYPDSLTQREVEVLRRMSARTTDRVIAEELFIGVRTVSFHVGNILNKTDPANRMKRRSTPTSMAWSRRSPIAQDSWFPFRMQPHLNCFVKRSQSPLHGSRYRPITTLGAPWPTLI